MKVGTDLSLCAKLLKEENIVCFPTETVFGLGVIYSSKKAYDLLNIAKGKREEKPYTMMLADIIDINQYAYVDEKSLKIIKSFMPGQLTILLKAKENVPSYVTHNTGVIGIRIPDYDLIRELIRKVKKPLLVPSANRSNEKPALSVSEAMAIFKEEVSYYIKGEIKSGLPSTILDCSNEHIKIIRQGSITLKDIEEVLGEKL